MTVQNGQNVDANDYITSSTGSGSSGKIPKLGPTGRIHTSMMKFGGTGADGALTVSSGTTSIDLGGAAVFVKNYSSISITGTGKVNFTNAHANGTIIIFKVKGDVTLTSSQAPMLDMVGLGSGGGTGGTRSTSGGNTDGSGGTAANAPYLTIGAAAGTASGASPAGGTAPTAYIFNVAFTSLKLLYEKYRFMWLGGGGGGGRGLYTSGSGGSFTGGNGGKGGGSMIMEVAGAWNFTTAGGISVAGAAGTDGVIVAGPSTGAAAGGSGGGAGMFIALYETLTANSGTVTIAGGAGGVTAGIGGGTSRASGSGGNGISNGSNGGDIGNGVTGPAGATGYSYIGPNEEFA